MRIFNPFEFLYHKILGLFVEFDVEIYGLVKPAVHSNRVTEYQEPPEVLIHELFPPKFKVKTKKLKPPVIITYLSPDLKEKLRIHDFNDELYHSVKIKEEPLQYLCVPRDYDIDLVHEFMTMAAKLDLSANTHEISKKEIHISHSLRTIEEILELEPYTKKFPCEKVLELPVVKYPVKKEKFSEAQLETIQTRLAIQAKCKKYSMAVENIYDKIPVGLYDEVKVEKDSTVRCTLKKDKHHEDTELQILATGKRKYDTQTTKVFIKYSELGM